MKTTVITKDGNEIKIKGFQKSLIDFPSYARKMMADDGTPYLMNCVQSINDCGCKISGNGTLQFPLSIVFCKKHK
jgi:hypothetical protein